MNTHPLVAFTVRLVPFALGFAVLRWAQSAGAPDGKAGVYALLVVALTGIVTWALTPMGGER